MSELFIAQEAPSDLTSRDQFGFMYGHYPTPWGTAHSLLPLSPQTRMAFQL